MLPVIICGGGIGGLTLAAALSKCKIPYIVLEQSKSLRLTGGGIGLWGPALKGLRQLGIENKLKGKMMVCAGYRKYNQIDNDEWLVRPNPIIRRHTSCLCLKRSLLQVQLHAAIDKTTILYGAKVENYREDTNGDILAILDNGNEIRGSVLVGADGMHSTIRKLAFPKTIPMPCGYYYWQGISNAALSDGISDTSRTRASTDAAFEAWAPQFRFGMVPISETEVFWFTCSNSSITRGDAEASYQKQRIFENVKSIFGDKAGKLIANTNTNNLFHSELHEVPMMKKWVSRKVVLVGDAAHGMAPNLAQGACLSIEDALELAHQLRNTVLESSDMDNALAAYQSNRQPRTWLVQTLVPLVHIVGAMSTPYSSIRDLSMRMFPEKLTSSVFDLTHRIALGWSYTSPNLGQGLYHRLLGGDFMRKHPRLSKFHGEDVDRSCSGTVIVSRGSSFLARLICNVLCLPKHSGDTPGKVTVDIKTDPIKGTENWSRKFEDYLGVTSEFNTIQDIYNEELEEVFGNIVLVFENEINDTSFSSTSCSASLRIRIPIYGWLYIPIPKLFSPVIVGTTIPCVDIKDGVWKFSVSVKGPPWSDAICGQIIKYEGCILQFTNANFRE